MVYRRAALGTALGAALVLGPLSSAALAGEDDELTITEPAHQSRVAEGETFTVSGTGCPAGSDVRITGFEGKVTTTTAAEDGSFQTSLTMPEVDTHEGVPESGEWALKVACGDERAGVLLIAEDLDEQDPLEVFDPADGTKVAEGEAFTVRGAGCPVGAEVGITGWDGEVTTGTAEDGTFAIDVTMPELDLESKTEEFVLSVSCGDQETEVGLVAVDSDHAGDGNGDQNGDDKSAGDGTDDDTDDDTDQVVVVPEGGVQTGPGASAADGPAVATLIGTLLTLTGSAALAMRRLRTRRRFG